MSYFTSGENRWSISENAQIECKKTALRIFYLTLNSLCIYVVIDNNENTKMSTAIFDCVNIFPLPDVKQRAAQLTANMASG